MSVQKNRGGRPRMRNPRTERIDLRLTRAELAEWWKGANKHGEGLAAFVRMCVRAHLRKLAKEG